MAFLRLALEDAVSTQMQRIDDWIAEVSRARGCEPAVGRSYLIQPTAQHSGHDIFDDVDL